MHENGIATLIFDTPGTTVNVLSFEVLYEFDELLRQFEIDKSIKALFIESAKEGIFIAGADIHEIEALKEKSDILEKLEHGQAILNRLEDLPFPTVAVIDGACLGGGLELAMACDYRIVSNDPHTRIGLPEVSLGIIPGLGGTQRLPLLVGFSKAIELITASKRLKGDKALKLGLVDASVPSGYLGFKKEVYSREILAGRLKKKAAGREHGIKWYEMLFPVRMFIGMMARRAVLKQTDGHYPAPIRAVDVVEKTLSLPLEEGLRMEREAFAPLAISEISKNLIGLFFTSEALKKEPFSAAKAKPLRSAAVIGVGTMGSGIAWVLAQADIPLRLGARKMGSISRAIARMMNSFESLRLRGRLTGREIGLKMDRVTYASDMEGFEKCDIVIEAVSEDAVLKQQIFSSIEERVGDDAVIVTNTSSLAITDLLKEAKYPERFAGMHFFNPVSKMPLVEVIAGEKTSDETIATVVALARRLGKIPIKVGECAGFLVNRILLPYLNESAKMFEEGESIERIDRLLKEFGMPMGPFILADEVGIDIGEKVSNILYEAYGERMFPSQILSTMVEKKWLGKKTGRGFYLHKKRKRSVNDLLNVLQRHGTALEEGVIRDRAILIMVNEAARCLEEKVVANARYLDMAMVMGTGFPAFRGGVLRYADSRGAADIVVTLKNLEEQFGDRFAPTSLLVKMAEEDKMFYKEV